MKKILTALAVCSCIALGSAPRSLTHAVGSQPQAHVRAAGDTLHILAVMVQFQADNDIRTSGRGQFDLSDSVQRIIDAPPHDSAYFADHFLFAKNYFSKVSNGRLPIAASVMGRVITLPKNMQAYAPLSGNLPLASLVEDAWHAADSLNPGFPFERYDLFVVFHAGSGKDVDLRGSLGYDPTPYDLPSIYFNLSALQKLRGAAYAGVQLKNNFTITNSVVLPETENRIIPGGTGDFLLQLGVNGLIAANIGSHLGLPDLFDTRTGRTAIGRFGLMDGQSIFSFSGLFPPMPSAWERVRLGWADAVTVQPGAAAAGQRLSAAGDTVLRVPISAKEYFLLENRQRDRNRDGATLTIRWRGQEFTRHYDRDDDHFNFANVDSIYGTIVDVDEPDWSLPGLINADNNYAGGILIWHIDETVIDAKLPTNSINADENRRGVDLVEADGSQDIGQSYGLIDPGAGSEDGSAIDYWFKGNTSPVYKNEFSETTNPNSLSNTKAHSHVTINNFSDSAPVMTFDVAAGGAAVTLVKTIRRGSVKLNNNDAPVAADVNGDGTAEIIYTSGDSVFVLQSSLAPFAGNPSALFAATGGAFQPAVIDQFDASGKKYIALVNDSTINLYSLTASGTGQLERSFNAGAVITTPVYSRSVPATGRRELAVGVVMRTGTGVVSGSIVVASDAGVTVSSPLDKRIDKLVYDGTAWVADGMPTLVGGGPWHLTKAIASYENADHTISTVSLYQDNTITVTQGTAVKTWSVPAAVNASLAMYDVNGDGTSDILVGTASGLYAYNPNGTQIEHFPLVTLDGGQVAGSPAVFKGRSDGKPVICFGSTNGHIYAYGMDGKPVSGFPIQTGGMVSSLTASSDFLLGASTDSSVYVWNVGELFDLTAPSWSNYLGTANHANFIAAPAAGVQKSDELMPAKMAYNWPNPVYDKTTHIRYYLGQAANVTVKIFTMAGESVATLRGSGAAHTDNEIDWDVSTIQSGIYLAQIEADAGGQKSSTLIKIAVVK